MDALKFSIDDIPARGLQVAVDVPLHLIKPEGAIDLPLDRVRVEGTLREAGGDFLFQGELSGVFEQACDRCLEALSLPLAQPLTWIFEEGAASGLDMPDADLDKDLEEEGAVYGFVNGVINIAPLVWEETALALPAKFVCDLSDTSTCPRYNEPLEASSGDLGAGDAPISQFAALKDLLPDLLPEHPEE